VWPLPRSVHKNKIAYALEIERTNQEHATLVLARNDLQKMGGSELQAFLLMCARRHGWVPQDQLTGVSSQIKCERELAIREWCKFVMIRSYQ
jgi:hypothetical protein